MPFLAKLGTASENLTYFSHESDMYVAIPYLDDNNSSIVGEKGFYATCMYNYLRRNTICDKELAIKLYLEALKESDVCLVRRLLMRIKLFFNKSANS